VILSVLSALVVILISINYKFNTLIPGDFQINHSFLSIHHNTNRLKNISLTKRNISGRY